MKSVEETREEKMARLLFEISESDRKWSCIRRNMRREKRGLRSRKNRRKRCKITWSKSGKYAVNAGLCRMYIG